MVRRLGIDVETLEFVITELADPVRVQAALEADKTHRFNAVIVVQTDTSTSTTNDIAALRQAIDAAHHPALFMVDAIASFACEPMNMPPGVLMCLSAPARKV